MTNYHVLSDHHANADGKHDDGLVKDCSHEVCVNYTTFTNAIIVANSGKNES